MNNLIDVQNIEGQLLVSSREVATNFEKNHKEILRSIENTRAQNCAVLEMFIESTYVASNGKTNKEYLMTRDGFSLLVMGFTGAKAMDWKIKYIEVFNKMEQQLKNPFSNLSPELQAIFTIDKKQQEIEVKVNTLMNTMTIDYSQQEEIRMNTNRRVIEILDGKESKAYKKLKNRMFQDIWRSYKKNFRVNSYRNT